MTFEEFDRKYQYNFRQDRLARTRELGFEYISHATVELYLKLKSTSKLATELGISPTAALSEINRLYRAGLCPWKRGRGGNQKGTSE